METKDRINNSKFQEKLFKFFTGWGIWFCIGISTKIEKFLCRDNFRGMLTIYVFDIILILIQLIIITYFLRNKEKFPNIKKGNIIAKECYFSIFILILIVGLIVKSII